MTFTPGSTEGENRRVLQQPEFVLRRGPADVSEVPHGAPGVSVGGEADIGRSDLHNTIKILSWALSSW